jgi:hypothetical protein
LEGEQWLKALKKEGHLANPTLDKTRRVMSLVPEMGKGVWVSAANAVPTKQTLSRNQI